MRAEGPGLVKVVALAFAFGIGRYARRTTPESKAVVAIRRIRTWRPWKAPSPLPQSAAEGDQVPAVLSLEACHALGEIALDQRRVPLERLFQSPRGDVHGDAVHTVGEARVVGHRGPDAGEALVDLAPQQERVRGQQLIELVPFALALALEDRPPLEGGSDDAIEGDVGRDDHLSHGNLLVRGLAGCRTERNSGASERRSQHTRAGKASGSTRGLDREGASSLNGMAGTTTCTSTGRAWSNRCVHGLHGVVPYGQRIQTRDWSTQGGFGMSTIVLIHGAGDVGWYWHLVEAELRERGQDSVAPDLPCDDDAAGLPEYRDAVIEAIGDRTDLVVVAQSLAGFTAPLVCERVPVKLLVLVAPMIPAPGEAPADYWANTRYAEGVQERYEDDIAWFYQDVPQELASEALRRSRRQSEVRMGEPSPLAEWPDVHTRVVLCRDDRLFPAAFVRRVARERLGITPDEIDGGHTPALSRPKELAERLEAYAAEASVSSD
jgi:pimeloyl-ACP methyl ester carboxylesterase